MNDKFKPAKPSPLDAFEGLRAAADVTGRMRRALAATAARLDAEQAAAERRAELLYRLDPKQRRSQAQLCVRCPANHVLAEVHAGFEGLIVLLPDTVTLDFEMDSDARARTVPRRSRSQVLRLDHAGSEIVTGCRCARRTVSIAEVHEYLAAGKGTMTVP